MPKQGFGRTLLSWAPSELKKKSERYKESFPLSKESRQSVTFFSWPRYFSKPFHQKPDPETGNTCSDLSRKKGLFF